ncbi:2'-5' RNA ligase family protein [Lactiplantibacillus carotarum]|uniref:2'-5' RNA ligase family protein n=1 Tax=Lactiplantibacillus carotarum TaxID=2993456 RepID=UPI00298EE7B2|nr:2'-5' RNA ligase family protein [Lactiplantibacillus carotarum]
MRSILIFPTMPQSVRQAIHAVRTEFDPLASHVRPHVSVVFPFELVNLSDTALRRKISQLTNATAPFEVTFDQLSSDGHGTFWLQATRGADQLIRLHDQFYQDTAFAPMLRTDIPYRPHITLGRADASEVARIIDQLPLISLSFQTTVTTITAEVIAANGDSIEIDHWQLE